MGQQGTEKEGAEEHGIEVSSHVQRTLDSEIVYKESYSRGSTQYSIDIMHLSSAEGRASVEQKGGSETINVLPLKAAYESAWRTLSMQHPNRQCIDVVLSIQNHSPSTGSILTRQL